MIGCLVPLVLVLLVWALLKYLGQTHVRWNKVARLLFIVLLFGVVLAATLWASGGFA